MPPKGSPSRPSHPPPPTTHRPRRAGPLPGTEAWRRWLAAGAWLHQFACWDIWATLTFAYPTGQGRAVGRLRDWLDRLAKECGGRVICAYGVEGVPGNGVHIHAVVSFPGSARVPVSMADSFWKWGHARIQRFDPQQGACWYLAKHGDAWDVTYGRPSKHWPRQPGPLVTILPAP